MDPDKEKIFADLYKRLKRLKITGLRYHGDSISVVSQRCVIAEIVIEGDEFKLDYGVVLLVANPNSRRWSCILSDYQPAANAKEMAVLIREAKKGLARAARL